MRIYNNFSTIILSLYYNLKLIDFSFAIPFFVTYILIQGVYELKEEFYQEYNVFFYHYTREDQSKAENVQRARLKAAKQKEVN